MTSKFTYNQYIREVLSGDIITGDFIKLAVKRHVADLKRQSTENFPYYFDEKHGQRFITFAQTCKHWKGTYAKEYIKLEPWQQFYFIVLFGWMKEEGGYRFNTSYLEIGRKNGKTTMLAIKALAHLKLDKEAGAQAYIAATKEDQARIGFKDVTGIIKASPGLSELFKIYTKSVTMGDSFIRPLGSDSNTQDGFDPSRGYIDEYHAHPTSEMLNVLESGMAARQSPMIDIITTAGYNQQSPCYTEMRKTAIEVLKGIKEDESLFALIYSLDEEDDWNDEGCWIKANPNIGVSVRLPFLRERYLKAKNESGSKEVDFKTKNLNIWTQAAKTWIADEKYMECFGEYPPLKGLECNGALDLASVRDIAAFYLVFTINGKKYRLPFFFIPEEAIRERSKRDGVNYETWYKNGFLIKTPGNVTDYDFIRAKIGELNTIYHIVSIAYDRWNASQLIINLTADGFTCNPFGQGFASMSTPTKELEKLIMTKEYVHDGNPVERWMFGNIMLTRDAAGNIKIDKGKSKEKVDGPVALVMALGESMTNGTNTSVYEERGILTL